MVTGNTLEGVENEYEKTEDADGFAAIFTGVFFIAVAIAGLVYNGEDILDTLIIKGGYTGTL